MQSQPDEPSPHPPQTHTSSYPEPPHPLQSVLSLHKQNYQQLPETRHDAAGLNQTFNSAMTESQYDWLISEGFNPTPSLSVRSGASSKLLSRADSNSSRPRTDSLQSSINSAQTSYYPVDYTEFDDTESGYTAFSFTEFDKTSITASEDENVETDSLYSELIPGEASIIEHTGVGRHIFLTFNYGTTNELHVGNIAKDSGLLDKLHQAISIVWSAVTFEEVGRHCWRLQFDGHPGPWASSCRISSSETQHKICYLYRALAAQGYSYLTTVNTSLTPSALLIFELTDPDPLADFFALPVSHSGSQLSQLDMLEPEVIRELIASLRSKLHIVSDCEYPGNHTIGHIMYGRGRSKIGVDHDVFHAYVVQFLDSVGFKWSGSISMDSVGPVDSTNKLLVFKDRRQRRSVHDAGGSTDTKVPF